MGEFLRIDAKVIWCLWRESLRRRIVFGSPNDVLRSILGLESKHSGDIEKKKNIRIDDEVWEELKSKAKQLNMPMKPLDKLLEKILELEGEEENEVPPIKRPPTRRR